MVRAFRRRRGDQFAAGGRRAWLSRYAPSIFWLTATSWGLPLARAAARRQYPQRHVGAVDARFRLGGIAAVTGRRLRPRSSRSQPCRCFGDTFAAASTIVCVTLEFLAQLAYTMLGLVLLVQLQPDSDVAAPVLLGLAVAIAAAVGTVLVQRRGFAFFDRMARYLGGDWAERSAAGAAARYIAAIGGDLPSSPAARNQHAAAFDVLGRQRRRGVVGLADCRRAAPLRRRFGHREPALRHSHDDLLRAAGGWGAGKALTLCSARRSG